MPDPRQHLQTIIDNWHALNDMLDTHVAAPWPPAGRYADYERALLDSVRPRHATTELEVPAGQPPLDLEVIDTARTVTVALVETADHIAAAAQRAPLSVDTGRGWTDEVHRQAVLLAARDQADPRRWPLDPNAPTRTAPFAAVWLQQRLTDPQDPGAPIRPLTSWQRARVARVAEEAARRVEAVLVIARRREPVAQPCPHCRGPLVVEGGDGQPPAVHCTACGWARTADHAA